MAVDERAPGSIFGPALRATSTGLVILITLIAFEAMAVAAALPTAARAVHGLAAYGWAFTGFLIADVVGMVASGQLSDSRGPRLPLLVGLTGFVVGLVLAGTATTMVQLVAGRVVQGFSGGLMITAVYVVIGQAYPERLRPSLFAVTSSAWVVPSLVGPVVSGALAQHASWRWVFLGLVPFAFVGGLLLLPVLRSLHAPAEPGRLASPARLVRAVAVAAGIAAMEEAGQHPSPLAIGGAVVGLAAMIWGLHALLPVGTFRVRPGVSAPIAMRGLVSGAFFGVESAVPLSLSVQHGYGATMAGLPLAASGMSWAVGSWWQGRADDAAGPHVRIRLIRIGFLLVAIAAGGIALSAFPGVPGWLAYPAWLVSGVGAGLTVSSVSVLMLNFTNDADRGADSAALQLSDATASALTTGLAGLLVAAA
ncbi:MAG: MFS transporter, partial [Actinobacteria bacterium]|nr:MFS transporter [Actinomycetota bacterium]